mgnify:CR=1 FL=1
MSINRLSRQKLSSINDRRNYTIVNYCLEPYWDEGLNFYPIRYKGYGNRKKKRILSYQIRMYKTWKYNRTNQWKNK